MKSSTPMPSMGVLNLAGAEKKFQLTRYAPSQDIGAFIKHYWVVRWDLTGQEPYVQDVVPNPCVNLVVEPNNTWIYGAARSKYSKQVKDKGCVFGVKFKPGAFYPFIRRSVSGLQDCPLAVQDVFDVDGAAMESAILAQEEEGRMVELMESFIRLKLPEPDPNVVLINQIVDRVKEDRDITKVDELCESFHMNKRKLQRLFDQYVGVSPKWVIRLYRLQNAAELMDKGEAHDWLRLSMDLGFHDQSHFIKEFKGVIGKTPEEYARLRMG